jgi:lysophospholipase L1-like esterase
MAQIILLITLLSLTTSCSSKDMIAPENQTFSYLAVGDSYTIGEGVTEAERWPVQLATALNSQGFQLEKPLIIARTGWTTAELKAGIEQLNPEGPYDLVSLLIGVNNQFRGESRGYTLEGYELEFTELLLMAVDFAGGKADRVFVVSIPDYGVTPFVTEANKARVSAEIDAYNAANLEIANSFGIRYFNITPISRLAAGDITLLAPDKLHPSGKMYKMWVELMAKDILIQLKKTE